MSRAPDAPRLIAGKGKKSHPSGGAGVHTLLVAARCPVSLHHRPVGKPHADDTHSIAPGYEGSMLIRLRVCDGDRGIPFVYRDALPYRRSLSVLDTAKARVVGTTRAPLPRAHREDGREKTSRCPFTLCQTKTSYQ